MLKKLLLVVLLGFFAFMQAEAQTRTVTGTVTDPDSGEPLPGVNVVIKGTVTGTVTDGSGVYELDVPANSVLVFSGVGVETFEVEVGAQSVIDAQLTATRLEEVVVTAIGIERNRSELNYSFQELKSDVLEQKASTNLLTSLQGKLAGVNITGSSGASGASVNINIRGISTFGGSNQPLFVVDGIPVSNDVDYGSGSGGNTLFGSQQSNRAYDINPDLIETVSVLKGPAATALYGSRASAGAVIITTKANSKTKVKKTEVTIASSVVVSEVYGLPVFQSKFGQGTGGVFNELSTASFGPAYAGGPSTVTYTNYGVQPYQNYDDNVKKFYRPGATWSNTVTIQGNSNDGKSNYTVGIGHLDDNGVVPNSKFKRTNVQLAGGTQLTNGLKLSATITYTRSEQQGTGIGNGGSAFGQLTRIPRSFNLMGLPFENPTNNQSLYFSTGVNPRWSAANEVIGSVTNRVNGNVQLEYNVTKWFNVKLRLGADVYSTVGKSVYPVGSGRVALGAINDDNTLRQEYNTDLIMNFTGKNVFTDGFNVNLLLGTNTNERRFNYSGVQADNLNIPGFTNVSNGTVFTNSNGSQSLRRLVGVYGQLSLSYKNWLFVDVTGRVDQSSTLPSNSNTYFYPSANVGFVFSELFKINENILSFGKVRFAVAQVGRDADPYLLQSVYVSPSYGNNVASFNFPATIGGTALASYGLSTRIGSNQLKPEFVDSYEVGADLGFLKGKINVEFTYFHQISSNLILNVAIPWSTGFATQTTNVGKMRNEGIELLVSGTPVKVGGFQWDVSLNYSRIRNKVLDSGPSTQFTLPGINAFGGISPSVVQGQPYGVIVSTAFDRAKVGPYAGSPIINATSGAYAPGLSNQVVSDPNPDWTAGITNTFSYKGLSLSILFDTQQGAKLYSFQAQDLKALGQLKQSEANRDQPRILPGVVQVGFEADGTTPRYAPNNIQIGAQNYWGQLGGLASEAAAYNATRYGLRELTFGYTLPKKWLEKSPFGSISVSFVGRNLWFFAPGFPLDPEVNTQGAGNIRGMDLNGPLNQRSYGLNLKITL